MTCLILDISFAFFCRVVAHCKSEIPFSSEGPTPSWWRESCGCSFYLRFFLPKTKVTPGCLQIDSFFVSQGTVHVGCRIRVVDSGLINPHMKREVSPSKWRCLSIKILMTSVTCPNPRRVRCEFPSIVSLISPSIFTVPPAEARLSCSPSIWRIRRSLHPKARGSKTCARQVCWHNRPSLRPSPTAGNQLKDRTRLRLKRLDENKEWGERIRTAK